jgi:hypothetical protein
MSIEGIKTITTKLKGNCANFLGVDSNSCYCKQKVGDQVGVVRVAGNLYTKKPKRVSFSVDINFS